jgi:hypothetical protein
MVQTKEQPVLTADEINKMSINQLREEIWKRKKSTTGIKKVQQACLLRERHLGVVNAPGGMVESTKKKDEAVPGFTPGENGFV